MGVDVGFGAFGHPRTLRARVLGFIGFRVFFLNV